MTKEQFIEKYGDLKMVFTSFHKFSFFYQGFPEDGGILVVAKIGGDSSDIYEFNATPKMQLSELFEQCGEVYASNANNEVIDLVEFI